LEVLAEYPANKIGISTIVCIIIIISSSIITIIVVSFVFCPEKLTLCGKLVNENVSSESPYMNFEIASEKMEAIHFQWFISHSKGSYKNCHIKV